MQDVPEATHRDSTSTDSIQSVIKISECCRTPVECGNSIQVTKRTEERNADLVTSLAGQSSTKQDQKETPCLLSDLARSGGRQLSEALDEGRQYDILLILPCRHESQQVTDILASRTLRKVAVADVEKNRSASKSNLGDSRETHKRNGQLTHTCVKCISGVYLPLNKGKKEIKI